MKQSDYVSECVGGIEVHIFGWDKPKPAKPLLFYTHGRTGAIHEQFDRCRELADLGLVVVGLDQRNHGRRLINQRLNRDWSPDIPAAMYAIMLGTAMDISLLIDLLPAQLHLPTDRAGVMGSSLGGHVTLLAMAMDKRLAVGGAMVPGGDYRQLMKLRLAAKDTPAERFDEFYPPELDAAVRKFDPIHNAAAYADRPLLMTCGQQDNIVPCQCATSFYDAARPHYTKHSKIRISIYVEAGHNTPPEAWTEQTDWLKKWLIS